MSRGYARRQLVLAALAANAVRPMSRGWSSIPGFALGWPTSELAPHLLGMAAVDTGAELTVRRGKASRLGLLGAAAAVGMLGYTVASARRTGTELDAALRESIGDGYLDEIGMPGPLDLRLPRGSVALPFNYKAHDIEVLRDVPYTEGGRKAHLDIRRPKNADLADAPVLIQIHGGGWTIGHKEQQGILLMNRMAQLGWVCVSVNYRLAPKYKWPTQIVDVKRAIAWVHENIKEYGGDSSYVVVTGGSAGGHLASLATLTPNFEEYQPGFEKADTTVSACVSFYGVYDMGGITEERSAVEMRDSFLAPRVFGKDPKTDLEDFVLASPLSRITEQTPDFFIIHGSNDTVISVKQAHAFVKALKEKSGASITYAELPGTQHAFELFSSIRSQHTIAAVARWLQWHRAKTKSIA